MWLVRNYVSRCSMDAYTYMIHGHMIYKYNYIQTQGTYLEGSRSRHDPVHATMIIPSPLWNGAFLTLGCITVHGQCIQTTMIMSCTTQALNLVQGMYEGVASAFGGVPRHQQTLQLVHMYVCDDVI